MHPRGSWVRSQRASPGTLPASISRRSDPFLRYLSRNAIVTRSTTANSVAFVYHFGVHRPRLRLLVPGLLVAALAALLGAAWVAAPAIDSLGVRLAAREQATGVRHPVPLQRVAPVMREAIVATEDERFYSNHGIDLLGIARAIPYDIAHLSFAQGASTITDQLAKLLYLNGNDHSPWRKLEDLALALKISTHYSKEQVLDAYLNSAYFGG